MDSALPPMCHNIQLPCNAQSSDSNEDKAHSPPLSYSDEESAQPALRSEKDCLSHELLAAMLREADRAFCGRYTGAAGGDQATKLSTYGFMKEVTYTPPLSTSFLSLPHLVHSLYCILSHDSLSLIDIPSPSSSHIPTHVSICCSNDDDY